MSPFGGNGVNFALLDAAELARGILGAICNNTDIDEAVRDYETAMFARTGEVAVGANEAIVDHFAVGGVSVNDVPDFAEEAERWVENATAVRAARKSY
jgi:2-polyprenyl-6-methoxyphenol hydroxylase-like FAD-dependent oxidoreductase